jgi:hypothetical protein
VSPPRRPEDLSSDQLEVYDTVVHGWFEHDGPSRGETLTVGGLAGTGKTSLLSVFAAQNAQPSFEPVAFVAYTGRAASNLARKFAALGVQSTSKTMEPEGREREGRGRGKASYPPHSPEARLPFVGTIHRHASGEEAGLSNVAIISWTNRMRIKLNGVARTTLRFKGTPRRGEQIICLKNSPPIFNGMRGFLQEDARPGPKPWNLLLSAAFPEENIGVTHLFCNAAQFNRDRPFQSVEELQAVGIEVETMSAAGSLYDFGYCLTAHKAQGSGFNEVVVYVDRPEEPGNDDYRRWAYTAVTRAISRLTVLR